MRSWYGKTKMKTKSTDKISWMVPFKWHFPKAKSELSDAFSPAAIIRIMLAIVCVFVAVAYATGKYVPDLEFDWTDAVLKCLISLVAIIGMCFILAILPPSLTVSSGGISITQGQTARLYKFKNMAELCIVENKGEYSILKFRTREQSKVNEYAIASKESLDDLRTLIENNYKPIAIQNN